MNKRLPMLVLTLGVYSSLQAQAGYLDPEADLDSRVDDLMSPLTLEEKVDQMLMNTPGIPQLDIPLYDYWNEALHGVGRSEKGNFRAKIQSIFGLFLKKDSPKI